MRSFAILLGKELRELLNPQLLLPFVSVMVVFMFIGKAIRSERQRTAGPERVILVDEDRSAVSARVGQKLAEVGLDVAESQGSLETVLEDARKLNYNWVVLVPAGFGANVANAGQAKLSVYGIFRGASITQSFKALGIGRAVEALNAELLGERLTQAYPGRDTAGLRAPFRRADYVVFKGKVAEGSAEALAQAVMGQTVIIPMVLIMVIIYASQMIAASVGQEKENKTLETLLTTPVSRVSVVAAKMTAAALFALVASGIYMVAFGYYMSSFAGEMGGVGSSLGPAQALGLVMNVKSYLAVGLALFLAVVCALSLAMVLALFADDARGAQVAVTPLMLILLVPFFLTMFFDFGTASTLIKVILLAIPLSYPFLVPRAMLFGDTWIVFLGYGYMTLFAVATMYVAARLFASDKLLTARQLFRRRRRPEA